MNIKEYSLVGTEVLTERKSIIIGISINNSYFKEPNLEKLISWACGTFESVYIMIPDQPTVHTLLALGRTKEKAEKEARLKANNLENKCLTIIERFKYTNIKIVRWGMVVENIAYVESLIDIKHAYDLDAYFKQAIRKATREVLVKNLSRVPTENEVDVGINFLLQELAFICRSPEILNKVKTAYVYHKTMLVMKDILEDKYAFKPSCVGFITAE